MPITTRTRPLPKTHPRHKRQAVSKRLRFEVLQRDKFTCRYCGNAAPGVVLHVDHLRAVAEGGDTSLQNLVTACLDCNIGKSDRPLSNGPLAPTLDVFEEVQAVVQAAINNRRYYCRDDLKFAADCGVDLAKVAWWVKRYVSSRTGFLLYLDDAIDHARRERHLEKLTIRQDLVDQTSVG